MRKKTYRVDVGDGYFEQTDFYNSIVECRDWAQWFRTAAWYRITDVTNSQEPKEVAFYRSSEKTGKWVKLTKADPLGLFI